MSSRSVLFILALFLLPGCKLPGARGPASEQLMASRHYSQQGMAAMDQSDFERAETILSRAVRACPDDPEAHRHYAEALWQRGRREEAAAQLAETLRLCPDDPTIYVRLAQMRLEMGQAPAARLAAEQSLDLDPKSAAGWAVHGRAMLATGDQRQALADFHRALGYSPNDRQILHDLAEIYQQEGQPQRALLTLQKLNDTYPPGEEPSEVLSLLGVAYTSTGRYDAAVETFSTALLRDRPTPELLARMAEAQLARGRAEEAANAAREALTLDPTHEASRLLLSRLEAAAAVQPAAYRP